MEKKEIEEFFCSILQKEEDVSAGVAAIRTLFKVLEHYKSETVQELDSNLQQAIEVMRDTNYPVTAIVSGCELFRRFITLAKLDTNTFDECKQIMLERGLLFLEKLDEARGKIVKNANQFIVDGSRILTHSRSRVVLHTLKEAAKMGKRFEVYVTKSAPDNSGGECEKYYKTASSEIMYQTPFVQGMCTPLTSLLTWRAYKPVSVVVIMVYGREKDAFSIYIQFYYCLEFLDCCEKGPVVQSRLIQISPFTQEEMRDYKSMQAFVKVLCKWVKTIDFKYIEDCCVVIGKILHSQRINETPLKPWVILKNEILYAHCTCIAGLGETCGSSTVFLGNDKRKISDKIERMCKDLKAANIPCTLILDSAVGYVMEQINFVMVGAEGVVESGGIVNKVGSYTIALCAKELKKPVYVLTESFKFARLYPLSQQDLPDDFKYTASMRTKDLDKEHPLVDYTPPAYLTLLFTDLGILTPSAVSDELIKLYL